jgi:uncharacterized SAM-binding protein YcdF (DUF218 family)
MTRDGTLSDDSRGRAELAAELLRKGVADLIVVSGGAYRPDTTLSLSTAMRSYMVNSLKVSRRQILSDSNSLDTVGDAYYIRKKLIALGVDGEVHVVTSRYHIRRVKRIFKFVFGPSISLVFHTVNQGHSLTKVIREFLSLVTFLDTFKGVPAGDISAISERLISSHELYKDLKH